MWLRVCLAFALQVDNEESRIERVKQRILTETRRPSHKDAGAPPTLL